MFFSLLAGAFCCPGRDGHDPLYFVPPASYLTKVLSMTCIASWSAPLLILWPHLLPLPLTCSSLATLTPLPFFFSMANMFPHQGFWTCFTLAWNGFFSMVSGFSSNVSPECSMYSIFYLTPLITLSFSQPCFILFILVLVTFCHVICLFACLYVCVSFPLPLLFVFPFVESGDLEPIMLGT